MNKRRLISIFISLAIVTYFGIYGFLQSIKKEQGNIFKGQSLPADYTYSFDTDFEEFNLRAKNGGLLNSLLFKADNSKGVICFWKGNGGTLKNWGEIAPQFLKFNYDILITDYRQHGKSKGNISLENFYSDAQTVYNALKSRYPEDKIVITGYSLGGRIAAHLAADNSPRLTLLIDAASTTGDFSERFFEAMFYPLPSTNSFLFQTEDDIVKAKSPVVIIGTENPNSLSHQLKPLLKSKDAFFEIKGATHENILSHTETDRIMGNLLK
ncbi:MAG: lysophospholipase [Bacteroidota bacterium]|nr:lysophospholipase [Bacteroidota bacterium]